MPHKPVAPPAWLRLVREPALVPQIRPQIKEPEDVVALVRPKLEVEEQEVFVCLFLNAQAKVIGMQEVTRGLLNSSLVHPREVFRLAVLMGAAAIVVAHNHPSGDPTPSAEDRTVTQQLAAAGRLLDIPLYDHVIVAGDRFVSFATSGLL
jgi:DNA repair protein RadC